MLASRHSVIRMRGMVDNLCRLKILYRVVGRAWESQEKEREQLLRVLTTSDPTGIVED